MSKLKSLLLSGVGAVAVAAVAIGGTVAYLQDSDSDVNVMTLGEVKIEQIEQERNEAGELVEFSQAKPAYPAVGNIAWDEDGLEVNGTEYKVFDDGLKNVVDKIVTVNNTGKSDAYVRTLVAIEAPDGDPDNLIHLNYNGTDVTSSGNFMIEIDGVDYYVTAFTYKEALAGGEKSAPSLMQLFLDEKTTNEDCAAFGDLWDVKVLSQAIQAAGFADAQTALDTGFGEVNADNAKTWFSNIQTATLVSSAEELKDVFKNGGYAILEEDISLEKLTNIEPGAEVYLDMNGKTITVDQNTSSNTLIWVKEGAKLTIDGNGTFDLGEVHTMAIFYPEGDLIIENGTFIKKFPAGEKFDRGLFGGVKNSSCNVVINGGYFDGGYYDPNGDLSKFTETHADGQGKPSDRNEYRKALKENVGAVFNFSGYGSFKIYGGTFVGANPAWGDEGCALPITPDYLRPWSYYQGTFLDGQQVYDDKVAIPDGYTITEGVLADGRPTYTVEYSK